MDELGIIVKKLKADALSYHTTKEQIINYLNTRYETIKNSKSTTEFDYCEEVGRIKELNEFVIFLNTAGIFTKEQTTNN
jgi:hypothetical protein